MRSSDPQRGSSLSNLQVSLLISLIVELLSLLICVGHYFATCLSVCSLCFSVGKLMLTFPGLPSSIATQNESVCICCCGLLFYVIVLPFTYVRKYIFRLAHPLPDTLTPVQLSGWPQTSTSICILWCSTSVFFFLFSNYLFSQSVKAIFVVSIHVLLLFTPLQSSPNCFSDNDGTQWSYVMRKKHAVFLGRDDRWKQCVTGVQEQATDEERPEWWCLPHF